MKKLLIALGVSAAVVSGSALAVELDKVVSGNPHTGTVSSLSVVGKMVPSSCQIELPAGGYKINLDDITQNEYNALSVGSGAKAKFISIKLEGCPGQYLGDSDTVARKHVALLVSNSAHVAADVAKPEEGVLKNLETDKAAQNVYIRLLKDTLTPVKLGVHGGLQEEMQAGQGVEFKIGAEYYRKDNSIALPGNVSTTATINFIYQ